MKKNKIKKMLNEGKAVFGPFIKLNSPAVIEVFGYSGFDFVIIDTEHGPLSIETAENLIRAAELVDITPIIRVSDNETDKILRALDIGAQGVQVPQISCKEDAEKVIKAAKFAPLGERGVCRFVRAASYSAMDRYKYFSISNDETLVVIHIEGIEGIRHIDEILETPGIDVVFLGPYDLSQSVGVTGNITHPKVEEKMKEVILKANSKGVIVGTFVDNIEDSRKWLKLGVKYISYSVDVGIIYEASRDIARKVKEAIIYN
jgi:4-hydroxy-2-oxoheptanedioate aldolase